MPLALLSMVAELEAKAPFHGSMLSLSIEIHIKAARERRMRWKSGSA